MKKSYKFLLAGVAAVGMMGLTACTGDLDLEPTNPNETTAGNFKEDPDKYMEAIFGDIGLNFVGEGASGNNVLGGVANGSFATFSRAMFNTQEIPTDEATWLWYSNDVEVGTLPFGIVSSSLGMATAPYYRLTVNMSLCNNFIASCDNGEFAGANQDNMRFLRLQATTLREICMYYMLDLYGNAPWVDGSIAVGSVPAQMTPAEIYHRLVAEMEETLGEYDKVRKDIPYGYFGKDCHEAFLVRLYLNAKVYCGQADWANAYKHAKAIIDRHQGSGFKGSGLAKNYNSLFGQMNRRFAPGGGNVNEILWTLPANYDDVETFGAATLFIPGFLQNTGTNNNGALFNWDDQWNCVTTRIQLAEKFDWNDAAMSESPDQRVRFWLTSKHGYSFDMHPIASNAPAAGYSPIKYTNWAFDDDGNIDAAASGDVHGANGRSNVDFAMVRLAEIYLSAAEAIMNGGGGSQADALTYVNYIRERAGLNAWAASDLNTQSLRDERQRELYTELTRRTDLKRYGLWISGYNWAWKGSTSNAEGQDFPASFEYYPLPTNVCSMAGYTQNPGY